LVSTTKQQLLRKAAHLIGLDDLSVRMKVPQSTLDAWMHGRETMPDRKLIQLADLLDRLSIRH
jgi:hypothetical protein